MSPVRSPLLLGLLALVVTVSLVTGGIALAPAAAHLAPAAAHHELVHLIHPSSLICATLPLPMFEAINECARQLAISPWSVKDLLRKQKLRAKKHGRRTMVEVASRLEYAASLPDATFAPPRDRSRNSDAAKSMTD
jgi:hypothetical protein